jgi:predicted transcriptional regulator
LYRAPEATRDRVLALVLADPGLHLREAPRRLGVSLRTARYHLDALVLEGRAVRQAMGGFVRFFPAGVFDGAERDLIGALRVANQRAVVEALLREAPQGFTRVMAASRLGRSTLALALHRLEEAGVARRAAGGQWELCDPAKARAVLEGYRARFPDRLADAADAIFGAAD